MLLLSVAGFKSVALVAVGLAGLVVAAAAGWWALTRRGVVRGLALVLAVAAPVAVLASYAAANLLWLVLVSVALWALAAAAGWAALRAEAAPATTAPGRPVAPPRHACLLMNPRSGGGKVGRFRLKEKAEALGAEVVVLGSTTPSWDVAELAREALARGADLLGVAGGDGTQALVADVAAEHGVPFVVIPAGTRNHFALDLGLDREDPSRSLEALTDGVELRVDLGRVGGRVFVNNASFGAYAEVVQSPAYRDDKVGTLLRLLPDVLTHQNGPRLTVRAAGAAAVDGPQAVLVSNNPYRVGDRAGLGRRDRLDGGVLGLVSVKADSAVEAADLLRGRRAPGLVALTSGEIVVDADRPEVQVGIDGEALALPTPVRCVSEPGALRVRVPRHRPGVPQARPRLDWPRLWELAFTARR
ncbi:diacylglycerol kinase family protein [Streptomyces roseifaciens]